MASAELSAYELERLANMRRNAQVLESLGLDPGGSLVHKPARKGKKRSRPEAEKEPSVPQRRSGRIQNAPAPQVYVEDERELVEHQRSTKLRRGAGLKLGGADAATMLAEAEAEADVVDNDELPIEPEQLTPVEREVYEIIREARNAKAKSLARSMFIVCGNRTMVEMCRLVPSTKSELLELHGMGTLKVQRYGDLLLDALRPHADRLREAHAATIGARESSVAVASVSDGGAAGSGECALGSAATSRSRSPRQLAADATGLGAGA